MFTRYLEGVHDYGHESPIVQIMVMSESKNDEDADGGETEVYNFKLKIDRWYQDRDSYDVEEKNCATLEKLQIKHYLCDICEEWKAKDNVTKKRHKNHVSTIK